MATAIKGKQVSWNVSAAGKAVAATAVTAGIVDSIDVERGGDSETITEDGDIVTRVDSATLNTISMSVRALATSTVPAKGTELTGLTGTLNGVDLSTGRVFIESAKATEGEKAGKKIDITAHHYPGMAADA